MVLIVLFVFGSWRYRHCIGIGWSIPMVDRDTNSAITLIILMTKCFLFVNNILYWSHSWDILKHKNGLESDIQNGSCTHALTQISSAIWNVRAFYMSWFVQVANYVKCTYAQLMLVGSLWYKQEALTSLSACMLFALSATLVIMYKGTLVTIKRNNNFGGNKILCVENIANCRLAKLATWDILVAHAVQYGLTPPEVATV